MFVPRFITDIVARRTMRKGMRAASRKRELVVYGYIMRHDCDQHQGEGQWYSDGSLRFTCSMCKRVRIAKPQTTLPIPTWVNAGLFLGACVVVFFAGAAAAAILKVIWIVLTS